MILIIKNFLEKIVITVTVSTVKTNLHTATNKCSQPLIDKGLLAHTRREKGVPPPKKNRENLKFALKFSVLDSITSGIVEVFSLNFFMRHAITARGISSS